MGKWGQANNSRNLTSPPISKLTKQTGTGKLLKDRSCRKWTANGDRRIIQDFHISFDKYIRSVRSRLEEEPHFYLLEVLKCHGWHGYL
jgi:hypothetical protein